MDMAVNQLPPYSFWWSDCMFMTLGSFFHYSRLLQDARLADFMFAQFSNVTYGGPLGKTTQPGLFDPNDSFYYRDYSYVNKTDPAGKKIFWGRGNGWVMAGLVQALKQTNASSPYAHEFRGKLQAMAAALKAIQSPTDGLWRSNLADAGEFPNPETTGSAQFTFGIAFGVNTGILDRNTYTPVVEAAWKGLSSVSLQESGLVGWCQPVGGAPGPANQTSTSDFCVGQFLLAGSQVYLVAKGV
jgi:rhamnogalacturonyl hydrolase YesR